MTLKQEVMKQGFVYWYVARVKYRTEKKIKNFLEKEGIQHYIPLRNGKPVIPCVVFIRTDYQRALSLPQESGYSITYLYNVDTKKFQVIPDKQMQDFMLLLNYSETTFRIDNPDMKRGERVRVLKGEFAGIEGELIRIRGHKRVVVRLEGLFSMVAGNYIPKEYLERI
jgi:transcription antitermination factor NusG